MNTLTTVADELRNKQEPETIYWHPKARIVFWISNISLGKASPAEVFLHFNRIDGVEDVIISSLFPKQLMSESETIDQIAAEFEFITKHPIVSKPTVETYFLPIGDWKQI